MFLDIVRFFLSGVCHQFPEHSLAVGGQALPLCARCTGTFLGVIAGLLALWASGQGRRSGMPRGRLWAALALLVAAWALDGVNSLAGEVIGHPWLYRSSNLLRLATGTGLGLVVAALLYPTIHYAVGRGARDEPVLGRPHHMAAMLLAGVALVAVLWAKPGAPYAAWALVLIAATVGVLAVVNGILIVLVLNKEGTATTWGGAALYAVAGLMAALAEMGALALLRRLILG